MEHLIDSITSWKAPVAVLWLALIFLAERWVPAAREPLDRIAAAARARGGWARVGRNVALAAINALMSPLIVLPLTLWAASHSLDWRPAWLSGWHGLLLDLLVLDVLIYWWHRANHRIGFLWRFHEVHHLDRFLDSTSALRFHFCEVLLSALARAAIVIVLDVPFISVLVFEMCLLVATVFHHSNLRLPRGLEGALSRVIITPSLHWVHHHARQVDTDSTYGTIFSFWDRLFGSSSPTERTKEMPIGVEGRPEDSLVRLLLRPFQLHDGARPR